MSESESTPLWLSIVRPVAIVGVLVGLLFVALWGCTLMPGEPWEGPLPEASPAQRALEGRLRGHVEQLAGPLAPRNLEHPERYDAARAYLREHLESIGGYELTEVAVPGPRGRAYNLVAERRGQTRPDEIVVIGAHYDSWHTTPGADDNASGVAAALELARTWAERTPARTLRLVFWANEEPPAFKRPSMGSLVDASSLRERDAQVVAMFTLEMLGYYDPEPQTQHYPPVLKRFYPDSADFVAFVGRVRGRAEVRCATERFRQRFEFPAYGFAGPSFIEGIDYSDHWSYWERGYPGVMVTDTSFFRNDHYHKPTDTAETLDYDRMARVVEGLADVLWGWVEAAPGCTR